MFSYTFYIKRIFHLGTVLLLLYLFTVFCVTMQGEIGMKLSPLLGRSFLALYLGCVFVYLYTYHAIGNTGMHKLLFSWLLGIVFLSSVSLVRLGVAEMDFIFLLSIFPYLIFSFFYFAFYKQLMSENFVVTCYQVFLFLTCLFFMNTQSVVNSIRGGFSGLNYAYFAILALPMCLVSKKKWISMIFFILTIYVALISMKRTGVMAMLGGIILFLFLNFIFSKHKSTLKKRSLYMLIAFIIFALCGLWLMMNGENKEMFEFLLSRFDNIGTDGGSGRSDIYLAIIHKIVSGNLFDFFGGHGGNQVIKDFSFHLTAHCDFLEIFYDYGFFALLLFGIIHGVLIKKMFELVKMRSPYAFAFTYSYSCFFLFSTFSHILIYTYSMLLFPFWALVFSKTSKI